MAHLVGPGCCDEPFRTLASEYPSRDIYPSGQFRYRNRWLLVAVALAVILLFAVAPPLFAADSACLDESRVLACFEAYKTKLRDFHYKQLDEVADEIAASFKTTKPLNIVSIRGHAATFKKTDPVWKLGEERAFNVRIELEKRLAARKLDMGKFSITSAGLANTVPKFSDATAAGRALNRRVEILLSSHVPEPPKEDPACKPDEPLREALRMMKPSGTDATRRARVSCLRDLYVEHFDCKRDLDPWYAAPSMDDLKAGIVNRFTEGEHDARGPIKGTSCAGKTDAKLAACMNSIDADILFYPNRTIGEYIDKWSADIDRKAFKKADECVLARKILEKARSKNSVYSCYEALFDGSLWPCERDAP